MNGKYYIGKNVSDFEKYKEVGPITGISLLVDDDMEYRAGDDSGFVLEVPCTHGTQQMADNILASLKGKTYKGFHADGAFLDPRAELGDGLTVNNTYSMLAYRKVSFGPGHMSEISAPGDEEVEHEYPYVSGTKREINRKLATVRSSITKKADEILLEVSQQYSTKEETKTTIEQTVKGITLSAGSTSQETFDLCEGCDWYANTYPYTNFGQGEQTLTPDKETSLTITSYNMTPKWYEHKISGEKLKLEIEYNVTKELGKDEYRSGNGYIMLTVSYADGTSTPKALFLNEATQTYIKGQLEVDVDPQKTISYVRITAGINNVSSGSFKVRNPKMPFTDTFSAGSSHLTLSANGIEISSTDITIEGVVTFTDLSTPGKTVIDGGNVTTGALSADRIQGGTLTLGGSNNIDGSMTVKNASGASIGVVDNNGINFNSGVIKLGNKFQVTSNGNVYMETPYISSSLYMKDFLGSLTDATYTQIFDYVAGGILYANEQMWFNKSVYFMQGFAVAGTKSRLVSTPDYSDRLLYCYEMPSPMFGDIGEGETDENGECYIYMDDVFTETVSTDIEYQVFLQEEGEGALIVTEKNRYYFVVSGTPGMKFSWEVKAKQRDYEYDRMELYDRYPDRENKPFDYERQYETEIEELLKEKETAVYEEA